MTQEEAEKILNNGYFKHNNYKIIKAEIDNVELRVDLTEESMNPYGIAHGGLIYGLGDTLMGMLAAEHGRKVVTQNGSINYLRPGTGKYLTAKGEIIKEGKNVTLVRANIYNDQDKLIATMDSNYFYID